MSEPVTLQIADQVYDGWTAVSISRSIETIAGVFDLTLTDRWPGQTTARPIRAGEPCQVLIGQDIVITGHIDDARPSFGDGRHSVRASGRDATGDLVDCSAENSGGEWKDQTLTRICEILCEPFGMTVSADTDVGKPFASFALNEGETVFEAIERACRMRAVLPISDGRGGVHLVRAENAPRISDILKTGPDGNILAGGGGASMKDRFSKITVKGQSQGGDLTSPEDNAEPVAQAVDPGVGRYRPLTVLAEDQGDAAAFKDRARWEASVRRARGRKANVTVQGWRRPGGALWQPPATVAVDIPELGLATDMLISAVAFTLDQAGSRTELTLAPAKAFELIALAQDDEVDAGW